jgi:predicted solute-binding protein
VPASLRIGCVKYLNARPLIRGWEGKVDFDNPAALCRKLARAELDVALVSSFEFLRNPIYSIVDGVSISSDGAVYSVGVAHRDDIDAIKEIELDPASETSVNLLRGLLGERGLNPRLVAGSEENLPDRARLLIGDQAIRFRQEHSDFRFWDLGLEWKRLVDLPFVYATWLIRPEVEDKKSVAHALRARRDENLAHIDELIEEQDERDFCHRYYGEHLRFTFGERERQGLQAFQRLCQKHGLLPKRELEFKLV